MRARTGCVALFALIVLASVVATAEPAWGVESVVREITRNGLAVPYVPSQARMSNPPLLWATTW